MKDIKESYKLIFGYLGIFLVFVGLMCLVPLTLLFAYPDEINYLWSFLIPGISAIVLGAGLIFLLIGTRKIRLGKHQDSILLVLIWICSIIICSIPFLCRPDMNFTEAIFETTSGFSTIGLTVFSGDMFNSHLYVFWRSLLTLIGGVGLVLVITTALSDKFHLNLYTAEGHNDKLLPNLRKSALAIFGIYLGIIILGTAAYSIVFFASGANTGDEIFDALVHSISAVATGGFSSKAGGIVEIESIYGNATAIEIISIILMLLGSINFLTHFFIITGKFKKVWKDCEIRFLVYALATMIPIFFVCVLISQLQGSFTSIEGFTPFGVFDSFRHGAFTFVSAITTTGFATVDNVEKLGYATLFLIVIVNIVGGGAGSTAGGVKQYRVVVAAKSFFWNTKARLSPSRMIYPHFVHRCGEDKEITTNDSLEAFGYIILYCVLMLTGALFVTLFAQESFDRSLFEFSNAISSTGLSNGITMAAAQSNNYGVLWTLTLGMFAGRLEVLPIYFALYRGIRDIFRKETV